MKKQILLLILVSFSSGCVKAALSGIDPEMAHILAGAADQVNLAVGRAEEAETQLLQQAQEAQAAKALADQLAVDARRFRLDNDALFADAAKNEEELRAATERAEQQAVTIAQLRRANAVATAEAAGFHERLQLLVQEHEAVTQAQSRAQDELERMRVQKEQGDSEVQSLLLKIASLESEFTVQRSGMSLPHFGPKLSAMAVFNPGHVDQEQKQKKEQTKALRVQLTEVLSGQQQLQDAVDEAVELVQKKDKEIVELSARAVVLEKERVELAAFKGATKAGFEYLDSDDVDQAIQGAAAAGQQARPPMVFQDQTVLRQLLAQLHRIARPALDTMTNK